MIKKKYTPQTKTMSKTTKIIIGVGAAITAAAIVVFAIPFKGMTLFQKWKANRQDSTTTQG